MRSEGAFWLRISVFMLIFTLVAGCSPKKISLYEKFQSSRAYKNAYRKATKTKRVYSGLQTGFIVSVTRLTPEYREALLREIYRMYYLDEERKEKFRKYVLDEGKGKERFFIALYTPDENLNDLDKENGHWSIRLVTEDDRALPPLSVEKIKFSPEEVSRLFPLEDTRWFRFYDVTFDAASGGDKLKVVLLSPVGRAALVYTPE
ncbi:MAG: hypothetical protein D6713_03415 [Deltaproteobacteria bacterium]|nr:MAG: hypothetical protein D6713_03415 [Deltaproteobacteria bacterium]